MKTLIIASMIAFAGTAALIAPTQAASLIIQSDDGNQYSSDNDQIIRRHHQRHSDYNDNEYSDNQSNDGQWRRHHRNHRCHTELVSHWRHHHRVVEEVRVCG
jgi:hypothetical protein